LTIFGVALVAVVYGSLFLLGRAANRTHWLSPVQAWCGRRSLVVQFLLAGTAFGLAMLPVFLAQGCRFKKALLLSLASGSGFVMLAVILKALGIRQPPPDST